MPIISKNNQLIYGRHEQMPRPAKKQQNQSDNSSSELTEQQQQIQQKASNALSYLKEIGYGFLILMVIVLTQYKRTEGLLSTPNSVMSTQSAELLNNYLSANINQISITPIQPQQIVEEPKDLSEEKSKQIEEEEGDIEATTPTCHYNNIAYISTQATVSYILRQNATRTTPIITTSEELIPESDSQSAAQIIATKTSMTGTPASTQTSTQTSTEIPIGTSVGTSIETPIEKSIPHITTTLETIASSTTHITFTVKTTHASIYTGSTLPLLHHAVNGMCVNQTKIVRVENLTFDESTTDENIPLTLDKFLTTIFPSFAQGSKNNQTSTLQLPIELEVTLINVVSVNALQLKLQQDEQDLLRQGDFNAFIRATIGKINPIFLFILYVGFRFGLKAWGRIKGRKFIQRAAGIPVVDNPPTKVD